MLGVLGPGAADGQPQLQVFPLGTEFQINTFTTGPFTSQSTTSRRVLGGDATGTFVAAWSSYDQDGSGHGMFGQRYTSTGSPLGTEFPINTFTTGFQLQPSVTSTAAGNFIVVWESGGQDGDGFGIFGQRYASSGTALGTEFQVNTVTTSDQSGADIAVDAAGNFVVVWANPFQDFASGQRFDSAGSPQGTQFQVNTVHTGFFENSPPAVAASRAGNFVVVWTADDDVFGKRYDSGGIPLGTEFQVNTYTTGYQYRHAAAADALGNVVVVWASDQDGGSGTVGTRGIFGQRYNSVGNPLGTEFRVNTYTTSIQTFPAVAAAPGGDFLVTWTSTGQDGDGNGTFGQYFNSLGIPNGTEFQISTFTTGDEEYGGVAASADGTFMVAWTSENGQDGYAQGVFGQRYLMAYETKSQMVGAAGTFGTDSGEGDGATTDDQVETTVTTPNAGPVTITERANSVTAPVGYSFVGQQVTISAPSASASTPLKIVFQLDASLRQNDPSKVILLRNGVCVPNCIGSVATCTGGPTMVNPSPCTPGTCDPCESIACVSNRCFAGPDIRLTVLTSTPSDWNFALPACPANPDPTCTSGFAKGLLTVKDAVPGKEKLIAKLIGGPLIAQADFGDPLGANGTLYTLCMYDNAGTLAGSARIVRAGDSTCSGGVTACWKTLGGAPPSGIGYKYNDTDNASDGIAKILFKASPSGARILFKAKGPAPPFPHGIPAALMSSNSVTLQVRGDDAPAPGCFSVALNDIKKQEPGAFKAK
jgi:hypothetical protein